MIAELKMSVVGLTSLLWSILHLSQAYNLDTDIPAFSFTGNISEQFGHKVLYFETSDNNKWIVVGAPYKQNKLGNHTGGIYSCPLHSSSSCAPIDIPDSDNSGVTSIGLTLTRTIPVYSAQNHHGTDDIPSSASKLLVCSPSVPIYCDKMMYMNGICYEFEDNLVNPKSISFKHGQCSKKELDLVFLFDGSESLTDEDFIKTKKFMITTMEKFRNTTVQFSAVQFSKTQETVFSFNRYKTTTDLEQLLASTIRMKDITNVFEAIEYVIDKVYTAENGARENAVRAMIIITDGKSTDFVEKNEIMDKANNQGIIRFAIGIGTDFTKGSEGHDDLKLMSSSEKHMFTLAAYKDLENVLFKLREKIFAIEGDGGGDNRTVEHFNMELSQTGFSAAINSERMVLGAVGAYDWAGALVSWHNASEIIFSINSSQDDPRDSYLGYALKEVRNHSQVMYAVGAPRYQHTGKVVLVDITAETHEFLPVQHILGEQIGSYFGAELETVDLDDDGNTDLLLIGAPLYHTSNSGGLVYVCILEATSNFSCKYTLKGKPGNLLIRFGAAIASVGDINGDKITDIVVGAPLEDEHLGAIYLFSGTQKGITKDYTQHIKGSKMVPGFKYFGQSIYGKEDLDNDALNDIIVGAAGKVVIIRSNPIVNISITVEFVPEKVKPENFYCTDRFHVTQGNNLTLCFHMGRIHTGKYEAISANLTYQLLLDTGKRGSSRLQFENNLKTLENTIIISLGKNCKTFTMIIPRCSEDFTSPFKVDVTFSQNKNDNAKSQPVIQDTSKREQSTKILFEKNCGEDDECISDLGITFDFSGTKNLVLQTSNVQFRLNITLTNEQEDASYTTMNIKYPSEVSFRKITPLQKITVDCDSTSFMVSSVKGLTCNISHPVMRQKTVVMFEALFDVNGNVYFENDILKISVVVQSENENNTTLADNSKEASIPVQNSIYIAVLGMESSSYYVDFIKDKEEIQMIAHLYEVQNHGDYDLPVNITFNVPTAFSSGFTWTAVPVKADNVICIEQMNNKTTTWENSETQENSTTTSYHCHISNLTRGMRIQIELSGMASIKEMVSLEKVKITSTAKLDYNKKKYFQKDEVFHEATIITQGNIIVLHNHMPLIIGSGIGGLVLLLIIILVLYKIGFFKRNLKREMQCRKDRSDLDKLDECEEQQAEQEKPQNGEVKEEKDNA